MDGERRSLRRPPLRSAREELARLRREMEMLLAMFPDLQRHDDRRRVSPRTYTARVIRADADRRISRSRTIGFEEEVAYRR